jgi:hypothetical protein
VPGAWWSSFEFFEQAEGFRGVVGDLEEGGDGAAFLQIVRAF